MESAAKRAGMNKETTTMATDKDRAFIEYIVGTTDSGKTKWEPAAEKDRFITSFRGKYKVTLAKGYDRDAEEHYFYIKLADENNQELVRVYSVDDGRLSNLYSVVQRKALKVDEALDEIMGAE